MSNTKKKRKQIIATPQA